MGDRISSLANTLIPQGKFEPDKEYIDVSKYCIGYYKYKRGKVRRKGDCEENFTIFKIVNSKVFGTYYETIDKKLVGILQAEGSIDVSKIGSKEVNVRILAINRFDTIRLRLKNMEMIQEYVACYATKEEIADIIFKTKSLYLCGDTYLLNGDDNSCKRNKGR